MYDVDWHVIWNREYFDSVAVKLGYYLTFSVCYMFRLNDEKKN